MEDKQTGSEWSHILGEAMSGRLTGTKLTIVPSVMTNWRRWKAQHPKTTVTMIEPSSRGFETKMLTDETDRFGFGLVYGGKSRLWKFDDLLHQPVLNDELGSLALAIYFDPTTQTPVAWARKTSASKGDSGVVRLTFRATEQGVQDIETQSTWDMRAGVASDGPLEGTSLTAVPAIVTFNRAWLRFHPESSTWKPQMTGPAN